MPAVCAGAGGCEGVWPKREEGSKGWKPKRVDGSKAACGKGRAGDEVVVVGVEADARVEWEADMDGVDWGASVAVVDVPGFVFVFVLGCGCVWDLGWESDMMGVTEKGGGEGVKRGFG